MTGRRTEETHTVFDRAALRISSAVIEPPDARERDSGRAHCAGLKRHIEVAFRKPLRGELRGRLPDDEHLAVRGRIAVAQSAIAGARDHGAVAHDHGANRDLAGSGSAARLGKCVIREGMWHKGSMTQNSNEGERIAKVMARAGLCSRREAEAWIEAGRVAVNGEKIASPALNVTRADRIAVDGKALPGAERTRLFLYHKPRGLVTTTSDPQGRPTIFGALPKDLPRLISIGRLDLNTEGLLLLTNDGGLARALELPSTAWLRRYRVRAHGKVTQEQLDALRDGVTVDGIHYGAIEATLEREQASNVWITFAIREGKNREVRNVLRHLGLHVARLIRVSFGPFQLGELGEGAIEEIPTRVLRDQLGEKLARAAGADFSAPIVQRKLTDESTRGARQERGAPAPPLTLRTKRDGAEDSGRAAKSKVLKSSSGKKFHRPRHGENARPSFDERNDAQRRRPQRRRPHK